MLSSLTHSVQREN